MRPLLLKMTGFGPYAKETTVDFGKLGTSGLYLVTGDTGAGKTSIFDAISFALFGEASGDSRKAAMLRSIYADDDTPTVVELTFSYNAKTYTVRRNPEYTRKAKRGGSLTKEGANAELILDDGTRITKIKDVNEHIESILGIDKNQFSQIAMLAQGDFQKLLASDTKAKQDIFRKLFKTDFYADLQELLKESARDIKNARESEKKTIERVLEGIACADSASEQLQKAKAGMLFPEEALSVLSEQIARDRDEEAALSQKDAELSSELEKISEALSVGERFMQSEKNRAEQMERFEREKLRHEEHTRALTEAKSHEDEISALDAELVSLRAVYASYDALEAKEGELSSLRARISEDARALSASEQNLARLTESLETMRAELDSLKNAETEEVKIAREREKCDAKLSQLQEIRQKRAERNEQSRVLQEAQTAFERARQDEAHALTQYTALRARYLSEQAGVLAQNLRDDEPCPVCGALHHPSPAKKSDSAPTPDEVDAAERTWQELQQKTTNASETCASLTARVDALTSECDSLFKKCFASHEGAARDDFLARSESETAAEKTRLAHAHEEIRAQIQKKHALEAHIPETETEKDAALFQKGELESAKLKNETVALSLEAAIREEREKLPFESKAALTEHGKKLRRESDLLKEAKLNAESAWNESSARLSELSGSIKELSALLESLPKIDWDAETQKKQRLESQKAENFQKIKVLTARIATNEQQYAQLEKAAENLQRLDEKFVVVNSLSETANGQLSGKGRLMLETYVQMSYFDKILRRANQRFLIMSDGQYELVRREELAKTGQSGLEIDVIDHYKGGVRSVHSLSGGESFMASLSLALGLSDEIQESAGGIQLDTMFVDEGFGTLDENTLQLAMKALYSLSENNRLVGIISHVAELKEKIDRQIIVTKTQSAGSIVEMNV